jgi:hypothetical protein
MIRDEQFYDKRSKMNNSTKKSTSHQTNQVLDEIIHNYDHRKSRLSISIISNPLALSYHNLYLL